MKLIKLARFRPITLSMMLVGTGYLLPGCVYDPVYYGPPSHRHYYPDYYDYYFYPSARVYFHFTTGYYYYWIDGRWVKSRQLPPQIKLGLFDRVKIRVDSDKPYIKYDEHIRTYKPRPGVQIDREKSLKEKEANERWYREYEKSQIKKDKKPAKDKMPPGLR